MREISYFIRAGTRALSSLHPSPRLDYDSSSRSSPATKFTSQDAPSTCRLPSRIFQNAGGPSLNFMKRDHPPPTPPSVGAAKREYAEKTRGMKARVWLRSKIIRNRHVREKIRPQFGRSSSGERMIIGRENVFNANLSWLSATRGISS